MIVARVGFIDDHKLLDEVEFDTHDKSEAIELFKDFCKEQKLVNPKIEYIDIYNDARR